MKKLLCSCLSALFISVSISAEELKMPVNPFIRIDSTSYLASQKKPLYTADPSARVWNIDGEDVLYVYPSHDMEPPRGCDMMDNYHVFSTKDMGNWTDHGVIFGAADVPWGKEILNAGQKGTFMWAPDCVYRYGKYYYYFPHPYGKAPANGWGNWRVGLAISDYPDKDFVIQDTTILGLRGGDNDLIDPCVFIDVIGEDTTAYFYYGGGQAAECWGGVLNDDMKSINGEMQKFNGDNGVKFFHEGAWVFKRINDYNDTIYYLTYPGNNESLPNYVDGQDQLLYATSNRPLGPWTFKGSYLSPTGCNTSHGSVVEFKGQWYAFYHNSFLSGGDGRLRSICVDKLYFEPNGDIRPVIQTGEDRKIDEQKIPGTIQAENFKNGGEGIGYHDSDAVNTAGSAYRLSTAVDIANSSEGLFVTSIENGEWLAYDVDIQYNNTYRLEARVASDINDGRFHITIGEDTVAIVDVPNTGGLNRWSSVFIHNIELTSGNQEMRIVAENGGYNLNDVMFTLDSLPPIGDTIVIQQSANYLTMTNDEYLRCIRSNRTPADDTEKFIVIDLGNDMVAFRNVDNKKYIGASSGAMSCSSYSVTTNNRFVWCYMWADNYREFAIKSSSLNKIVYIDRNDTSRPMKAVSDNVGGWETFSWRKAPVAKPSGIANVTANSKVMLYPVPAEEMVAIVAELNSSSDIAISISDLQGKILKTVETTANSGLTETNISVGGFPAGLYLVNVVSDEFNVVKKLVVN